jgi:hypothetical protein
MKRVICAYIYIGLGTNCLKLKVNNFFSFLVAYSQIFSLLKQYQRNKFFIVKIEQDEIVVLLIMYY